MENRHGGGADNHHSDGQPEVELHEPHAIHVRLAGGGNERDRAGLRGHNRKRHGVPRHGAAGQQVAVYGVAAAAAVEAVGDNRHQRGDQDDPIERSHRYARVNR